MKSLQSLRGICALMIFFHHLDLFDAGGDAGVCFFLILSGFVMSAGYMEKITSGKIRYGAFLKRRLIRIYPYHLVGFFVALVLLRPFYGDMTALIYGSNLLMVQSWIPDRMFFFSCDSPSWCLSDFLFCYAMFPVLARFITRSAPKRMMVLATMALIVYIVAVNLVSPAYRLALIYINPLFRLVDFFIGMLLWRGLSSAGFKNNVSFLYGRSLHISTYLEIAVVLMFIVFICIYPVVPDIYSLASYWWLPVVCLIVVFSLDSVKGGLVSKVLSSSLPLRFGELSFAFYMLHVPVIGGYRRLMLHFESLPEYNSLVAVILIFSLTLLLSIFVTKRVIPPVVSLCNRIGSNQ